MILVGAFYQDYHYYRPKMSLLLFFDNNTTTLVAAVVVTVRIMTTVMSHGVNESRVAEKNRQENQKIAKKIMKAPKQR